jgi:hypothetical protein
MIRHGRIRRSRSAEMTPVDSRVLWEKHVRSQ